jgi:transcriptional regulator with XRE-family HTH domain
MLSTPPKKRRQHFRFISALKSLLKERGKTQKELAEETGLTQSRVCRLVRKKSVHAIVASTALKICLVLSSWPRAKDGKRIAVRLDALYPLKHRRKRI